MSKNKLNLLIDTLAYVVMAGLASTGLLLAYRLPPGTGGRHGGGRGALTVLGRSRHEWGDVHFILAVALLVLMVLHIVLHWKWVTNTLGALLAAARPRKAGAGLGGSLALLVLAVAGAAIIAGPWLLPIVEQEGSGHGDGEGARHRGGRRAAGASEELSCDTCAADCPAAAKAPAEDERTASSPPRGKGQAHRAQEPDRRHGTHAGEGEQEIRGRDSLADAARAAGVPVARLIAELKLPAATPPDARLGPLRQQHGFSMQDVREAVERLRQAGPPK